MSNAKIVKDELVKEGMFNGKTNKYIEYMANSLDKRVPLNMRRSISNYALSSFMSHFHTKILFDTSYIPTNYISFILSQSGTGKTSSVNKLEAALRSGYLKIEEHRRKLGEQRAKETAEANNETDWEKYKPKLKPLFNAVSTEAGIIKRLNDFKNDGIGMPSLFIDEISSELAYSPDIVPNIKLISELFDEGNKKSKALKDSNNQSDEVYGMGMCALLIGSEAGLLLNEAILNKFYEEFLSRLARRCFFAYPENNFKEIQSTDIDSILSSETEERDFMLANRLEISDMASSVADMLIVNDINLLTVEAEAERLIRIYKIHCRYEAENIKNEAVMLSTLHDHWRCLKLAGVYALADERMIITKKDYIEAVTFSNSIKNDLQKFIEVSKRQDYEILIDLLKIEEKLSIHELRKRDIIKGKTNPDKQIEHLVSSANSKLGSDGMVVYTNGFVTYEHFTIAEHGASFKMISGTKEERAYQVKDGYEYKKSEFIKLGNLLCNDTSYCAFKYKDGIRSNANIESGATFIILDIDDSDMTIDEVHDILGDFKHHIARTSNASNPYKFRVLIALDIEVNLEAILWKRFMEKVGEYLGLNIDILAISQQYYGFKGRQVLSNLEGEPLPASELIKTINTKIVKPKKVSATKCNTLYEDRFNEFYYAYNVGGNTGASALYRAFKHAYDLGFSKDMVLELLQDICEFRSVDFESVMKRTGMLNQIERSYRVV